MDDTLKRLVDVELRAEALVQEAQTSAEEARRRALAAAREEEERFPGRMAEIQANLWESARADAEREIESLTRRHEQRRQSLLEAAKARSGDAVEAALSLIVAPGAR